MSQAARLAGAIDRQDLDRPGQEVHSRGEPCINSITRPPDKSHRNRNKRQAHYRRKQRCRGSETFPNRYRNRSLSDERRRSEPPPGRDAWSRCDRQTICNNPTRRARQAPCSLTTESLSRWPPSCPAARTALIPSTETPVRIEIDGSGGLVLIRSRSLTTAILDLSRPGRQGLLLSRWRRRPAGARGWETPPCQREHGGAMHGLRRCLTRSRACTCVVGAHHRISGG
jgi:hypothetical protein